MEALDRDWLARHPLPEVSGKSDKDARGRVVVVGGAEFVPGALRLTGEAALRTGAGKLQLATVSSAAVALAVLVPEAAMIALPAGEDGEIAPEAATMLEERLSRCDCLVLGPGMSATDTTAAFVSALVQQCAAGQTVVLDAAALTCARDLQAAVAASPCDIILTPHHREMSLLSGIREEIIERDPAAAAQDIADGFDAVVALKGVRTVVASPRSASALFRGGSEGLATGGSGDVLAGLIGGFAARGADPYTAAGWGVFVHGTAGERLAEDIGPLGFLARELGPKVPGILAELCQGPA